MKFQVIQGGLAAAAAEEKKTAPALPGEVEAERLRAAILRLPVPDTGLTVEQALEEICSLLDEQEHHRIERGAFLCRAMEALGVHFRLANPDLGLARPGFLNLVQPARLLDAHPELAGLHPTAHPYLLLG